MVSTSIDRDHLHEPVIFETFDTVSLVKFKAECAYEPLAVDNAELS